jgi:branched-subunit amino acid ABC-type transport system permease component
MVVSSALAAFAGILIALDLDMTPTFGFNYFLYGVVAMIIGGVGSLLGVDFRFFVIGFRPASGGLIY